MDGLSFLQRMMADGPGAGGGLLGPGRRGTEAAFEALEDGAVAVIEKPRLGVKGFLHDSALMLRGHR